MISLEISKNKGNIFKFVMDGHAEYSEVDDIVCASASSAAWLVLNGIEKLVGVRYGYETGDGYIYFVLPDDLSSKESYGCALLLDSFELFMKELEAQYPEYIKLTQLEV